MQKRLIDHKGHHRIVMGSRMQMMMRQFNILVQMPFLADNIEISWVLRGISIRSECISFVVFDHIIYWFG